MNPDDMFYWAQLMWLVGWWMGLKLGFWLLDLKHRYRWSFGG